MNQFNEPWKYVDTFPCIEDADRQIVVPPSDALYQEMPPETAARIVAAVNALDVVPTEAVADPNFRTLLHTLIQYAELDDRIGQEQTGWVLGQFLKRARLNGNTK